VGQRKGLGIAARKPLYVISLDVAANKVIVGTYEEAMKERMSITGINWIVFEKNPGSLAVDVKIRYRQTEIPARIMCEDNDRGEIWLSKPQRGIAPGQAAVFYAGDVVVGGGVIE
jgi:tRNA-specific 2-thiouridylase